MNDRGFTLIELMVVTLVMAALMGAAAPSVSRSYRHWSQALAVDRLLQTAEYARERAVVSGVPVQLSVDGSEGRVFLKTRDGDGVLSRLNDRWGRGFILPEGLSLRADPSDIDFLPNGTSTAGTLRFQSSDGDRRVFNFQSLLGSLREEKA